jgi:ElaB/YqjD/DUF883 family membrane-anchored ribosome-binding protein
MNKSAETDTSTKPSGDEEHFTSQSERLAQVIHDAVDRVSEQVAEAEQRVRQAGEEARAKVAATQRSARTSAREAEHAVERYVDQHPWTALGVAFGAGIIISALLRR